MGISKLYDNYNSIKINYDMNIQNIKSEGTKLENKYVHVILKALLVYMMKYLII